MDLQKRTTIAVFLSVAIVIVYSLIASKLYPTANKGVKLNGTVNEISAALSPAPEPLENKAPELKPENDLKPDLIVIKNGWGIFEFSDLGADLIKATFLDYNYSVSSKALLRTDQWSDLKFAYKETANSVIFAYKDNEKQITKEFIFKDNYYIEFKLRYNNLSLSAADIYYTISSEFMPLTPAILQNFKESFVLGADGIILRNNASGIKKGTSIAFNQPVKWLGLRDKYFAYILSPLSANISNAAIAKNLAGNEVLTLNRAKQSLASGDALNDSFLYYCGPQKIDDLIKAKAGFEQVRYFGKLDILAKFLLKSLVFIRNIINSWGLAIIIITILIFFILYPLTLKQMHSMKKMQVLQPEIEKLRQQFKDNPKKLNTEIMQLYKEHNANPMGGCLPIILQIPIFFALFQGLNRGIELKGAQFLWIKDLSEPDRLYNISGKDLNLLPILMLVTMFFQQKMSMKSMPSSQAEQQKMMLWIMPIMFGFIFYSMPSGLVLYWLINSLLMVLSQWKALK